MNRDTSRRLVFFSRDIQPGLGDKKTRRKTHRRRPVVVCVVAISRVTNRSVCVVSQEFQRGAQVGGLKHMARPECALRK